MPAASAPHSSSDKGPAPADAAIRLDGVSLTYPNGVKALTGVSLGFRPGEFVAIIGPSGAGKSTLLKCLNLLTWPTAGQVASAGFGVIRTRRDARLHRARTGIVFQHHQLQPRRSALANVLIARIPRHGTLRGLLPLPREDQDIALHCLERVGLIDRALERVDRLSGGQQQRVGIARALAQDPDVMLADEPVASLDPATSEQVLAALHRVCREDGIPAIVNLHQVEYARQFADRIVGLTAGRVVFDGPPGALTAATLQDIYRTSPGTLSDPPGRKGPSAVADAPATGADAPPHCGPAAAETPEPPLPQNEKVLP